MLGQYLERRSFLLGSLRTVAACGASFLVTEEAGAQSSFAPVFPQLDDFVAKYMRAMNSPGLTLALADKSGSVRTAAFGLADLGRKAPVTPDQLFEIGSISKSFAALTLLQLRQEGKVDLNRPILDYLPWLPIQANYGVITVHHLLTHTSGLPDALGLFPSDPQARHIQGFKPGEHFHYCNIGFTILGHLIEKLDGRPWPEAIRKRIFEPLEMTSSSAVITNETRARRPESYVAFYDDRTYVRQGRLAPCGNLVFANAAGSVVATPSDMALYMQMLLRKGQGPNGRVVSEESFALFSKPYIAAEDLSPTASYGYGIGVDKLDDHTILRHTGGMASYMSALHVDLDGGVAAFASINAGQGYRPNPVTQFSVQLMNAQANSKPLPKPPELHDPMDVKNARDYAGQYTSRDGRSIAVLAEGERLTMRVGSQSVALQSAGGDTFLATVLEFQQYPIVFGRAEASAEEQAAKKSPAVTELMHGPSWYTNDRYSGPRDYAAPPNLQAFAGHYRSDSPWLSSTRVVLRKGQLWLDGVARLEMLGEALFRLGDDPYNPDTVGFFYVVDGKAQLMKLNGADLWRVDAA